MKNKKLIIAVVCTVMLALNAFAATYYISTSGSDANDGLTPGTAFGGFLHATEAMADNDTLVALEGVYTNAINRADDAAARLYIGIKTNDSILTGITFKGEGPDKTIFRYVDGTGTNVTDVRHFRFYGQNNLLTGFKMDGDILGDGWWSPAVYAYLNTNSVISNIWIKFPISITGRTGISPVWNNTVDNLVVTHCLIDGGGIGAKEFNWDDYHHTTFRNLTCVNQREGGAERGMGIVVEGNDGTIIQNCLFQGNAQYAISLWAPQTGVATSTVQNCLWWDTTNGFLDARVGTYAIESGTLNVNPNLQTNPEGLPYCTPIEYASYGWKVVPEPTLAFGLVLACLALIRRK